MARRVEAGYESDWTIFFSLPDISTLFDDATSSTRSRLTQAKLTAVVNALEWLEVARAWEAFDVLNVGAVVPEREATRFISCSQAGAGAHLVAAPAARGARPGGHDASVASPVFSLQTDVD